MTGAKMAEKIPLEKMDAVDQQQQGEIDRANGLAWGAIWLALVVTVINFGSFVFAMKEMGDAIAAMRAVIGK